MKIKQWLSLFAVLSSILLLAACGSNSGSGGDQSADPGADDKGVDPATGIRYVGTAKCIGCHEDSIEYPQIVPNYLESKHVVHSSHVAATDGVNGCLTCHDPLDDGPALEAFIDATNVPEGGLAAVGCETCHGPGGNHYGVNFYSGGVPNYNSCGKCHNADMDHIEYHPYADSIVENFKTSGHFKARPRDGSPCFRCHSDEGFRNFIVSTSGLDAKQLEDKMRGEQDLETASPIQCRTCHEPHTGELRADETDIYMSGDHPVTQSREFNLCTSCHQAFVKAEPVRDVEGNFEGLFTYTLDTERSVYHADMDAGVWEDPDRIIIDTHFKTVEIDAETEEETVIIEGYNINAASENACTICHDPHTAGKMLSVKEGEVDDNDNLAIDYAEGISEFHNDYLGDAQTSGCTPCHSGNSVVTLTVGGGSLDVNYGVHDVISCRTCHNINVPNTVPGENDPEGYAAVREFPADYEFAFNSGVNVTSEDLGVNKICFECHKGRTGALSADEESALVNEYMDDDVTYVGTENRSFAYLHYAPAYAILFGNESGMVPTYDDKTYAGRFEHPLPINGVAEFGCADCHNVHNTDDNNVVENKMATSIDCAGCHAANAIFAYTSLKDRTEEYSVALLDTLLEEYLAADGTEDLYPPLQEFIDVLQGDFPYTDDRTNSEGEDDPIIGEAGAVYASPEEALAVWLEGRTKVGPSLAAAKAGTIWKIFTYEDGSVEGPYDVHGHGGSWAHNSKFARQVMYDAIEDLQGDVSGLERP